MSIQGPLSDQLNTWSARHAREALSHAATSTHLPDAPAGPAPGDAVARFAHRALQTLRQTRLQMRHRPWPRPQVLSITEPQRRTSADGLCPPGLSGAGARGAGQLPSYARDPGGDLRHQPRAAAPPGTTLRDGGERLRPAAHRSTRYPSCFHPDRQHAGPAPRAGSATPAACGGAR